VVVWTLWIARREMIFRNQIWFNYKVGHSIMDGVIAYGRLEWEKTLQQIVKRPWNY
jgi:hypothetical protein